MVEPSLEKGLGVDMHLFGATCLEEDRLEATCTFGTSWHLFGPILEAGIAISQHRNTDITVREVSTEDPIQYQYTF